jgi:hypothetical protein
MATFRQMTQIQRIKPGTAVALLFSGFVGTYAFQRYFVRETFAETTPQPAITFKGGPLGFTSLRLHSAEVVNHNTKRLRFELPDPNARSGLSLTCMRNLTFVEFQAFLPNWATSFLVNHTSAIGKSISRDKALHSN